jgi:hypothetical protein
MALENDCSSAASGAGLGNVRFLRIARVSRILKIFNIQKVKDWVKKLKRNVPNTSLLQLAELLVRVIQDPGYRIQGLGSRVWVAVDNFFTRHRNLRNLLPAIQAI